MNRARSMAARLINKPRAENSSPVWEIQVRLK